MLNFIFQINNEKRVVTASVNHLKAYNAIKARYPNQLVFLVGAF